MIDQNTIISMLNDVVPQMQASKEPEKTLLKFAKEKNLPPSVLERMCHAFNQLKTNCYMDSADSMEKRGSQFSLIDSPELIKEYTKFAGENIGKDFDKSINTAVDFWDLVAKESALLKSASEQKVETSIGDLFDLPKEEQSLDSLVKSAFDKELDSVKSIEKEEKENFIDTYLETKATMDNLNDYIESLNFKRASIVDSVKKMLRTSDVELAKFASYENDAKLLDADVEPIIDNFVNEIIYKNSHLAENIKRASAEIKKHLIREIHPITQAIIDYSDTIKCLKVANMTKEALDLEFDEEGNISNLKPSSGAKAARLNADGTITPLGTISEDGKLIPLPGFDIDAIDALSANAGGNDNGNKPPSNPSVASSDKDPKKNIVDVDFDFVDIDNLSEKTKNNADKANRSKDDDGKGKKEYSGITKAIEKTIDRLEDSFGSGLNDLSSINNKLFSYALGTSAKRHSKLKPSTTKIYNSISDALFQKMMMTDPILSKLDPSEIPNIVEAYKSYKQQYPEIAFQPALLKSILRGAAQVDGGEDVSTLKELTSARKNLAQAKELENLNI